MPPNDVTSVVPAHPSFLAIYNPSLGTTDETLHNQIVYHYSKSRRARVSRRGAPSSDDEDNKNKVEDENERLRQIGLAQGMVSFAKNFSNGEPVDTVETEKSRIVMCELEPNWWILAHIDLTRLITSSSASSAPPSKASPVPNSSVEYSSREVSPSYLLLQQLRRAHSIFLLHHAPSLDSLYRDTSREKFCRILDRFWTRFVLNWDVILHGNPAVEVFNGIKLAGSGELGIGVGEEEWGSGEREVLEGFISRTDGLVDLVLSRFGNSAPTSGKPSDEHPWLGFGTGPGSSDGVVFSGIGRIAPRSVASVSQWTEWIFRYGEGAYGVREDPKSVKRRKKGRNHSSLSSIRHPQPRLNSHSRSQSVSATHSTSRSFSPGIPPPLIVSPGSVSAKGEPAKGATSPKAKQQDSPAFGTDTFMKMITLGYRSSWSGSSINPLTHPRVNLLRFGMGGTSDRDSSPSDSGSTDQGNIFSQLDESPGRFLLGLRNDLGNEDSDDEELGESQLNPMKAKDDDVKISSRTLDVNVLENGSSVSKRLRVVVYLYQPFVFTFLFDPETPSLASPSFYRSIHHQLGPLQKPLLSSTCPSKASQRLSQCNLSHGLKEDETARQHICDVVSDPSNHTVRSSLPNIPEPGAPVKGPNPWTRLDALSVHAQVINTLIETRLRPSETERTCKTNRGWWVLWMRLRDSPARPSSRDAQGPAEQAHKSAPEFLENLPKEAFLIRKASDYVAPGQSSSKGIFHSMSGGSANTHGGWITPGKLAEGIGLDAKKYIEALLSLNR